MYRTKEEKLVDNVLGEAIIRLLKGDRAIGSSTLIATLREMAEHEINPDRKNACIQAINDVRNSLEMNKASGSNVGSTFSQMFSGQASPDDSKKH